MIDWLKRLFESAGHKRLQAGRKDLHDNKNALQKSIATAKQSGRRSSEALRVAEHALKLLEKHRDGLKQ